MFNLFFSNFYSLKIETRSGSRSRSRSCSNDDTQLECNKLLKVVLYIDEIQKFNHDGKFFAEPKIDESAAVVDVHSKSMRTSSGSFLEEHHSTNGKQKLWIFIVLHVFITLYTTVKILIFRWFIFTDSYRQCRGFIGCHFDVTDAETGKTNPNLLPCDRFGFEELDIGPHTKTHIDKGWWVTEDMPWVPTFGYLAWTMFFSLRSQKKEEGEEKMKCRFCWPTVFKLEFNLESYC